MEDMAIPIIRSILAGQRRIHKRFNLINKLLMHNNYYFLISPRELARIRTIGGRENKCALDYKNKCYQYSSDNSKNFIPITGNVSAKGMTENNYSCLPCLMVH